MNERDERAWLIERPGPLFWSGREGCGAWTTHVDALRFARWQDADRMRIVMGFENAKSTEHIWSDTRAVPQAVDVEAVIDALLRVAPFRDGHEIGTTGLVRRADVEQALRAHFKNTVASREVEARSSNAPIQARPQPEEAAQPAPRGVEVGEGSEPSRHAAPATVPPHPELCECGHIRAMHFDEDGDHNGPCLFQVGDQPFCKCDMFHRHALVAQRGVR